MPKVTVNIADRGTELAAGGTSSVGHMWYELTDDQGNTSSYGFAPDEAHQGCPFATCQRNRTDSNEYKTTAYLREIEISQAQYDATHTFREGPISAGFSMRYSGLTNSCIDFTWKALESGGLNPSGFEISALVLRNAANKPSHDYFSALTVWALDDPA